MAEIVAEHLNKKQLYSSQYTLKCPGCINEQCRKIINPFQY